MRLSYWMIAKAVVTAIFGIGFVLIPLVLLGFYGLDGSPSASLMAQLFGAAFIFEAIVLWLCRNLDLDDVAARAIITGIVVTNTIGFVVTLIATLNKVWNAMGWGPVLLYLIFGLAFAYFLFMTPAPKKRASKRR